MKFKLLLFIFVGMLFPNESINFLNLNKSFLDTDSELSFSRNNSIDLLSYNYNSLDKTIGNNNIDNILNSFISILHSSIKFLCNNKKINQEDLKKIIITTNTNFSSEVGEKIKINFSLNSRYPSIGYRDQYRVTISIFKVIN